MTDSHVRLSGYSNSQLREKWERKVLRGWRTEDRVPRPRLRGTNHTSLTLPAPSIMTHDRAALPGRCDVLGREKGAFVN